MTHIHECLRLATLGYWIIPWTARTSDGKSSPRFPGYNTNKPTPGQVDAWVRMYKDGDWSIFSDDTVVLDIEMKDGKDGLSDLKSLAYALGTTFEEITRGCPCTRTKNGGYHFWYRAPDACPIDGNLYVRPGVEVKRNRSCHIPPSKGYSIEVPICSKQDLPELPASIVTEWNKIHVEKKNVNYTAETIPEGERRSTLLSIAGRMREALGMNQEEIYTALQGIRDNRCDGDFPDEELRSIADDIGEKEIYSLEGLAAAGDATAKSVLNFTSKRHYVPAMVTREDIAPNSEVDVDMLPGRNIYKMDEAIIRPNKMFADWDDWAKMCSPKYQPSLSMLTAAATFATLMGRGYRSPTNLPPNIYVLALLGAGEGKDSVQEMAAHLLKTLGLEHAYGRSAGSGDGYTKMIREAGGEILIPVDEFWRWLANWKEKNCSGYMLELKSNILSFFNGRRWGGKSLKREDEEPIEEPVPSHLFLCQPETFMSNMTQTMYDDGFMRRIIVTYNPDFVYPTFRTQSPESTLPASLVEACKLRISTIRKSKLAAITNAPVNKIVFKESAAELKQIDDMHHSIISEQKKYHGDKSGRGPIIGSAWDKITRLAMIYMWTTYPECNEVLLEAYEWGHTIVRHHSDPYLLDIHDSMRNTTQRSQVTDRMIEVIARYGETGASVADLMSRMSLSKTDVVEHLNMLTALDVAVCKVGKRSTRYHLTGKKL